MHADKNLALLDNSTKGGVDAMDQIAHKFFTKRKTNRWPAVYFTNILDGLESQHLLFSKLPSPMSPCANQMLALISSDFQHKEWMKIRSEGDSLFRPSLITLERPLHDNATPHSANLTQQWLQRYGWEILPYPAHSQDLAPSDFHLFGPLKRHLGGMAFETEDDLISELRNWFDNLDIDFFRVGINSLLSRWQKCIDRYGDYVEK
ncbi:histone-lysine N-methyltransferase SETMAR [Plakobranchus ocellatus]|uniref:Histone-lysine N-methyltransferase SETMAR n=1 Tax=Plakobranchus ocellatus TaxID=259542 RepID=A0AAV4B1N0_9GAST|nr:histone-lysine N-methyltransferase SETMAR [Plakobranchus ocellatus]